MAIMNEHAARQARNEEKVMAVLRFLRTTTYSTTEILGQVMGLQDHSAICRCLRKMEKIQVIRRHSYSEFTGTIVLWGITSTGQHFAAADGEEIKKVVFNSSKISPPKLMHYLTLQQLVINGAKAGWTAFQYCDKLPRPNKEKQNRPDDPLKRRADLLGTSPEGHHTAIEYERSLKAAFRYKSEILPSHVDRLNAKEYDFVLWITHTAKTQATLERIIKQVVGDLKRDGTWHLDVPVLPFKRFQFANLQTWPTQWRFELHKMREQHG